MDKKKYLTIQIIPHSGRMKSITVSYPVLWVIGISLGLIFLLISGVFFYYGKLTYKGLHAQMVEEENKQLKEQVKKIKEIESVLKETLAENRKIKQMLGIMVPDDKLTDYTSNDDKEEEVATGGISLISQDIPNILPVMGVISQSFSKEHPAIDIAVDEGTPVISTMSGKVTFAGVDKDLGKVVVIENDKYKTVYGHNSLLLVQTGDIVKKGDIIGLAGNTGHSSGPHVHYELYINGKVVDPVKYVMKVK